MNAPSRTTRAGLVVLAVVSVADVLAPVLTDGSFPPMDVALVACALGVLSLLLVALAWRGSRALVTLIVLRLLSVLAAAPVLFVPEAPVAVTSLAAVGVALTALGIVLVLVDRAPSRTVSTAVAR